MKKKLLFIYLFIGLAIVGYLIYRTTLFSKYENKLTVSKSAPDFFLKNLVNNHNLKVSYIKSYNYDKKCIGFDAVINDKYYTIVTKLGKLNNKDFIINKSNKDFTTNYEITPFPPDVEVQVAQYFSFYDFPFNVNNVKYYLNGTEIQRIDNGFTEIIFKGDFIDFSFNGNDKKQFGYLTPIEEMSVSFISFNNDLYAVIIKKYKGNAFRSLHSLLLKK